MAYGLSAPADAYYEQKKIEICRKLQEMGFDEQTTRAFLDGHGYPDYDYNSIINAIQTPNFVNLLRAE